MFNKLKQIKDLRDKAKRVQGALKDETAEGIGGWGKVKVKISGNQEILDIVIDPSLINPADPGKLIHAIKEATNDGLKKVQRLMVDKMRDMGELKF